MTLVQTTRSADHLPIVDMGPLADGTAGDAAIGRQLDEIFSTLGFCYFANTGVDQAVIDGVFDASRRFHALPDAAKKAITINDFHRGYMAPKTSQIITSSVARVTQPNNSESFMFMHEVAPHDPKFGQPLQGPNQWPADLPGFRDAVLAYDAALSAFCRRLLPVMARALALPPDWFAPYFTDLTLFLRLLHYPPQPVDAGADAFGSAPHTDYGFLTILAQDMTGGLSVRRADGTWLAAPPIPGTFVVNVGDMLSRWTNKRWQSTPHSVRNLSGGDRYSCPYFFDMGMAAVIGCVPTCTSAGNPPKEPPVRYGDYLMERLNKNYTYRTTAA
ncbi:MAG: 2-oxoglutarate and iron-dependent oxygenase domain-containing protein [Acetobacteraceae bacterium]|nr:2-oxoglutarate and iron-dependent oxygenase domain-containing protein [Acetobacteraceae bacterium]